MLQDLDFKNNLGQMLNIGLQGPELLADEKQFIVENNIGGVTLFARNLQNPEQIRQLCQSLQALGRPQNSPLFIGVDMEGGRVNRLPPPLTQWPSAAQMAEGGRHGVTRTMRAMGDELKGLGFNLNFAPCADTHTNPDNPIIGDRAFSDDASCAGELALCAAQALDVKRVFSCAKHFPGHGNTSVDSHLELPVEMLSKFPMWDREVRAFLPLFEWRVPFIMTAHILYPKLDQKWPATLSPVFLTEWLREDYRYEGLVITDDLGMKAITTRWSIEEAAVQAVTAGADILLYCNDFTAPRRALDCLRGKLKSSPEFRKLVQDKVQRVLDLKKQKISFFE